MYTLLVLFFTVSIVFSFLCSIWEAVLLSITPSFTEQKLQEGGSVGATLKDYKENIDRPLSAILTLNTIAHTVGAIGVGAQATRIWGASVISTAVVPVVMTLAILLLSEIVPKTIGATYWKGLANFTVRSLRVIMVVLAPLVWLSQLITKMLKKDGERSVLDRADFTAMAEIGSREGVFDEGESTMLRNLLRFDSVLAEHIMTPRTVVVAADETTTVRDFHDTHPELRFSRVPIYEGSLDHVTGYVLKDKILKALVDGEDGRTLAELRRPITAVEQGFPVPRLFEHFTTEREHIALVVDGFGGTAGIVTTEDVIETLLGTEIVDEQDNAADMQILARRQWEARARRVGLLEELESSIERQSGATPYAGGAPTPPDASARNPGGEPEDGPADGGPTNAPGGDRADGSAGEGAEGAPADGPRTSPRGAA